MLFMRLYFKPNIFNKRPFMPQLGNFLACTYVLFTLIWRIFALSIYLVKAKIVKDKIPQKYFADEGGGWFCIVLHIFWLWGYIESSSEKI